MKQKKENKAHQTNVRLYLGETDIWGSACLPSQAARAGLSAFGLLNPTFQGPKERLRNAQPRVAAVAFAFTGCGSAPAPLQKRGHFWIAPFIKHLLYTKHSALWSSQSLLFILSWQQLLWGRHYNNPRFTAEKTEFYVLWIWPVRGPSPLSCAVWVTHFV